MKKLIGILYKRVLHLAVRFPFLSSVLRGIKNAVLGLRFTLSTCLCRVDGKTVCLCSFEGRFYSDNPRALFEYMVKSGDFSDYTFIWSFREDVDRYRRRLNQFVEKASDTPPRLVVVEYDSPAWRRALASSGYWILNYKIKNYIRPKRNQIFLQTWHGTPLKRLGCDLEHFDNPLNTVAGTARSYGIEVKKFSYFLSASPAVTETLKSAWRMADYGKQDIIIEEGYPRNDILTNYSAARAEWVRKRIFGTAYRESGFSHKKVVLYTPTYRQSQHNSENGYTYQMPLDLQRFQAGLGDEFVVLFRTHYYLADSSNPDRYAEFFYDVSDYDDISDLYLIADILATDYSSTMFDFAVLQRPMVFYMYDYEYYRDVSNGFYYDPYTELPGPVTRTEEDFIAALHIAADPAAYEAQYGDRYRHFCEKFIPHEDGHVCERVTRKVFDRQIP